MNYFVTGATGFIGKRLIKRLVDQKRKGTIYFLIRESSKDKVPELQKYWGAKKGQCVPLVGDLTKAKLGLKAADVKLLTGNIEHFFHLAAIYDLMADAESQIETNIKGTQNAVDLANAIGAGCFQHVSSIAAAGLYEGIFREDMFDEAENLDHPYFRTKHDSEAIVRRSVKGNWRVYRPAFVVGDSKTGEMDKIDGPYYFFKLIQKMRKMLPAWVPTIGIEGGRINIVPVDFVVNAMDHIAHKAGLDKRAFHLVDPKPYRIGDVLNIFAKAAHAPKMEIRLNAAMFGFIPKGVKKGLMSLTPVRRIVNTVMKDLDLPQDVMGYINWPTRYDCRDTTAALAGSGIECPDLENYAWAVWDYWERHLDPSLFIDRTLSGQVKDKVVLITGGSSGIGLAAAQKIAAAGAVTIICGRDPEKLKEAQDLIKKDGHTVHTYAVDIANMDDCDLFVKKLLSDFGHVDVLINNAGRSIRRGIENSFDRFHDLERTMQLNYFGALRVTYGLLPKMMERRQGHVINISSIGVLTNAPRFSAYVASKGALDSWTRCAASEFADMNIRFTTINMPLVKTPMIAPTKLYNNVPTLTPEQAADMIAQAIIQKPVRIATRLGILGQVMHAVVPKTAQIVMNTSFRMFPDSTSASKDKKASAPTADQIAFTTLLQGIHF
ncbi:MAG TPA: SDR family oxidoreductase [Limnobacter sp.]|uniref:SDR family oxidoreductase n=1 Tax=Limnobacter sp. TaxID=2003368 RepID=UPI002E33D898|nr:SDR family oxidoreductase [Limnobacter sp.]HEX5484668.1 SDR family oxidoreductase [Limnobacter sp.]